MRRASCCPPPGGSFGTLRFYLFTALVLAASLAATLTYCSSMAGGMDMPGGWRMSMMWMRMPGQTWAASALMFLSMWTAMMVAMMLPSLMFKLLLLYRSLVWKRADHPGLSTSLAALGYFLVWTLLGSGVYALGMPWALAAMRWPNLSQAVPILTGLLLILAGAYQFSPWKKVGLVRSRAQVVYGMVPKRRPKPKKGEPPLPEIIEDAGVWPSFRLGLRQGLDCARCCAGSMLVLLVLGAMDLWVMLGVALVIALEKLLPKPQATVHGAGLFVLGFGLIQVIRSLF